MKLWNLLSMSIGFVFIIPFVLYYVTGNGIHFRAFLGVAGTAIISETVKVFFVGRNSPRPKGAKDCDLLCIDGNQEGRPGMPSSHSAEVTFFSGFYLQQTTNPVIRSILVIYAILMMASRYFKRCHTISQISAGALLGLSLSWIVVRHL